MNNVFHVLVAGIVALACVGCKSTSFIRTAGTGLVDGDGNEFRIRGTNLGHWLNPEGYMFGFGKCSSPHMIDEVFRQLVGPEEAKDFWKRFKDNYITEADIAFVAKTGANTVRLPFHYKLFTCEDYLGANDPEEGFRRMDAVIGWCRKHGLRVVIDMHDCPGGQTGSNIKESWLVFKPPEGWNETIAAFAKSDRSSYKLIQNRPERAKAQELLNQYLENCKSENCTPDAEYLKAVGLLIP